MLKVILAAGLSLLLVVTAAAEPGQHWQNAPQTSDGWIGGVSKEIADYGAARKTTAVMAVHGDQVIATFGDPGRKVNVRSVRKSMLSALYGIAVAEGRINLAATLADLGIDDQPPSLTAAERKATVRDLLMARSGIYHKAAYETADMQGKRPERGSHSPGEFWFYNNWDFNTLGTIYRNRTGEDIFASFERHIARPIGMEDFDPRGCRYFRDPSSIHKAYLFQLSARDMARVGLLFMNDGRWNGKQVIPAAWIRESTTTYSQTDRRTRGYGYLWWTVTPEEIGANGVLASGNGGQFIAIVPSKKLVVVETIDLNGGIRGVRSPVFLDLVRKIVALVPGN